MQEFKSPDRLRVLERIAELEKSRIFDRNVEDDPPFPALEPEKIDFLKKKPSSKIKARIANIMGAKFYGMLMRDKHVIFDGVVGIENLNGINGGAVITCNHCHMFDNYAVLLGLKKHFKRLRLYKIVREGNYALPGKIGFFMRNCDTLPVGSNFRLTARCMQAAETLLKRGEKILVYPEQVMWWNYRKPRPLKKGAFLLATKANVPVIPCFLIMKDSDIIGTDGFAVRKFTLHVLPPIYPPVDGQRDGCDAMLERNFALWKELYQTAYEKELSYDGD